jgi:putative hemolysin
MFDISVTRNQLLLRQASDANELLACQRLRYKVFYEEMAAKPDDRARLERLDADAFDDLCDHLIVVNQGEISEDDPIKLPDGELIGTYRLLRQDVAEAGSGFYTQREFDIKPLIASKAQLKFLELGRSCVLRPFRTRPVIELLWQGIWNYVRAHSMDVMLGCASLIGTSPSEHKAALSLLAEAIPASDWRVSALPDRRVEMGAFVLSDSEKRRTLAALPPLIKGYLRLGCFIGDGAVIDEQFNTTDILIILPVSAIRSRYFAHFGTPGEAARTA